ncbi:DNA mismatch repair protein MutS [Paludisphaera sp.]|uniref:MutS-related protein n=1 Tax=Paludisphaera sp. TaxID=2017432 RepID=UPI00301C1914
MTDTGDVPADIHAEYSRRLALHERARERWDGLDARVADARLLAFLASIALGVFIYVAGWISWWWLAAPLGVLAALVLAHEPIHRRAVRATRTIDFYRRGLARLEDRWAGTGATGEGFLDLEHPYAADIDVFGAGSLFERLCTARTRAGEETLASWLLDPAPPEIVTARQEAVRELRPRLDLREDLELLGADVRSGVDPATLAAWGEAPPVFPSNGVRIAAAVLATIGAAALANWLWTRDVPQFLLFVLVLLVEGAFAKLLERRADAVLKQVDERGHDLMILAGLLDRLEREPMHAPALRSIREKLETDGRPASERIRRLGRLIHLLDTRNNQFFLPFALVLLWRTQFAMRIDAWRAEEGPRIAGWLAAVGEFEALSALAVYAAENPADAFPEVVAGPARFEAEGLGHPLIPRAVCVTNDVTLGEEVRAMVVSGSNMSGKSTLLRSIGAAAVMAQAGAPARARRLVLSPLAIGATLRVQDSLQAGRSRFYAEITRVRRIVDLSRGPIPLLFLLDELFSGTNSRDRRIGAEAVIRGLLDRGAIGLLTTHDLALADIVAGLGPSTRNVHFEDHFEDGEMRFDYRMHPGVVTHSNALALMRAVGLEV